MNISKAEIIKLANTINLEVSDEEITNIERTIVDITERLDMLLNEEVSTDKCKISATENINQFDSTHENETENNDLMENLNNVDGEYIAVKKVIGDE